jgi:hypothetical protein
MAASTICLDSLQNQVSCGDADCSYGPCGDVTTVNSQTGNAACLDSSQTPINCADPSCTYGDCINPTTSASTTGAVAAANSATGGGTSISSIFSGLTAAATAAYVATVTPTPTRTVITAPSLLSGGSSGLLVLGLVAVVAFVLLSKKK